MSCPRSTSGGSCSTPGRRSGGRTWAGPCVPASSAARCSRAGPRRRTRRSGWPTRARSPSSRATTTTPSGRWRGSSRPRCRSSSPRTRRPARARTRTSTRAPGAPCATARSATTSWTACAGSTTASGRRCAPGGGRGAAHGPRRRGPTPPPGPPRPPPRHAPAEPIDLKSVTAQALQMGDECHSRNVASSALLTRALAPALARHADIGGVEALDFLRTNDYWFLNFSMVASKLGTMAGHGVEGSTVVTTFARNGVTVGIRVSGLGEQWFTAPAAEIDGLYFPGYGPEDANPDIGDSAIAETYGLGGFALAAAPAIVGFVGGTTAEAIRASEDMATITVGRHREYQLPVLGFAGSPVGIDVRKVLDTGLEPVITTGIAHREPGIGQIGAGLTRAPMECFAKALDAFAPPLAPAA